VGDLHPKNRSKESIDSERQSQEKARLFEVLNTWKMYGQVTFAKDMFSFYRISTTRRQTNRCRNARKDSDRTSEYKWKINHRRFLSHVMRSLL
jgi:hypothetical protein